MAENKVKTIREQAGLSQTELARRACLSPPNLSAIENKHREAWPIARKRLARALKCTESELFPSIELKEVKHG
jgi:transcriptional regulator with XRE-family HTH domain